MCTSTFGISLMRSTAVVVEVGLLHAAVLEGDGAVQRRGQAEGDGALDLRLDGEGVHDQAAVEGGDDAVHLHRALRRPRPPRPARRRCRRTRARRCRARARREGACPSRPSARRGPGSARTRGCFARSLRRKATGSSPAAAASSSIIVSITKAVCEWPTERHHSDGNRRLRRVQRHREVGDVVGRVAHALDARLVDAVLHHEGLEGGAGDDRLADDRVVPADDGALRVEARLDAVHVHRAVVAAADVVLARPHDLHRHLRVARDLARLDHVVGRRVRAPAEAAAGRQGVELHLPGREAQRLRGGRLVHGLELRAAPDLRGIAAKLHGAVERLHRGVREERDLVLARRPSSRPP